MRRKAVSGIVITVLLVGLSILAFNIRPVMMKLAKIIIVPDDYPTIQEAINHASTADTVYVRAGTYYENVVVNKTVSLVGENRASTIIDGGETDTVVRVTANSVMLDGFTIRNSSDSERGIYVYRCTNTTIRNNHVIDNWSGIYLYRSSNNKLRNNNMSGNAYNFEVWGWMLSEFIHDIDSSNTVDGKSVCYWVNRQNQLVPSDAGYVALINSTNITIKNLTLKNNSHGLLLSHTKNSLVMNNHIKTNRFGIRLSGSYNNTITVNDIKSNGYGVYLNASSDNAIIENDLVANNHVGIYLDGSSNNSIFANSITNSEYGALLELSSGNKFAGNGVTNNYYGILLQYSSDNTISRNKMIANYGYGILFDESYNNRVFHNNFINNTHQAYSYESVNLWDDGYPSGGNHWSDYTGTDANEDGIGDTPYIIGLNNRDNYPLMHPFIAGDINYDGLVNVLDVTALGKAYGAMPSSPNWNVRADVNDDDVVNVLDLTTVGKNYGKQS